MADLNTLIAEAETALHSLMTGAREQEIQAADGERVVYTPVNMAHLQAYIADLRSKQAGAARRPIYFRF